MLYVSLFYLLVVLFQIVSKITPHYSCSVLKVNKYSTTNEYTYRRVLSNNWSVKVACIERSAKRRADVINVRPTQGCHSKWYPVIMVTYFMDQICLASHVFLFMFARRASLLRLYLLSCSLCAVMQFLFPLFCYPLVKQTRNNINQDLSLKFILSAQ